MSPMSNEERAYVNRLVTEHNLMAHFIRTQAQALRLDDKPWYIRLYYALRPQPIMVPRAHVIPHLALHDDVVPTMNDDMPPGFLSQILDPDFEGMETDDDPDIHAAMERWHVRGKG